MSAPPDTQAPDVHADVVVLGAGPGGYTAAFRAADLGLEVVLIERHASLGGVCLNVGCIPSKALLHLAALIVDAEGAGEQGVVFARPALDLAAMRAWKESIVSRLTGGLAAMARQRQVSVLRGQARLTGAHGLEVDGTSVSFEHAILAAGSRATRLAGIPYEDARVMSSTDALALSEVPDRLLVLGGGIVGLELATVYDALGAEVTVVELAERLLAECDADLLEPLRRRIATRYAAIHTSTRVAAIEPGEDGLRVTFAAAGPVAGGKPPAPSPAVFDRVLVAVGRTPNCEELGLDRAGVGLNAAGFIAVDSQQRTNVEHIFAVGDLVGPPMLAHKATHEAKVAAEVIAGHDVELDVRGIPSVAYTDPAIAWVGLTERDAERDGVPFRRASFPWSASGRAIASGAADGMTKLLLDPTSNRLLGAGVVGRGADEIIAEAALAVELGVDTEDIALTVHAHPTLAETIALAAEVAERTITDLPRVGARAARVASGG